VKESLVFHTAALDAIQDKRRMAARAQGDRAGDIKDLLGISRKYGHPVARILRRSRVTTAGGERRVLREGREGC